MRGVSLAGGSLVFLRYADRPTAPYCTRLSYITTLTKGNFLTYSVHVAFTIVEDLPTSMHFVQYPLSPSVYLPTQTPPHTEAVRFIMCSVRVFSRR